MRPKKNVLIYVGDQYKLSVERTVATTRLQGYNLFCSSDLFAMTDLVRDHHAGFFSAIVMIRDGIDNSYVVMADSLRFNGFADIKTILWNRGDEKEDMNHANIDVYLSRHYDFNEVRERLRVLCARKRGPTKGFRIAHQEGAYV